MASADFWKSEPFREGVPLPYQAVFSSEEFARLKTGLVPQSMEDKWFVYYEEPHLFIHRSWTGQPVYRLFQQPRLLSTVIVSSSCRPAWSAGRRETGRASEHSSG